MEHDRECEQGRFLLMLREKDLTLRLEDVRFYEAMFCFCDVRRAGGKVRQHMIYDQGRWIEIYARLLRSEVGARHDLPEVFQFAEQVHRGLLTFKALGLDMPENVIEINFRKRGRAS